MRRHLYTEDHEQYRHVVREFLDREVSPRKDQWDRDRWIPREVYARAAAAGVLGLPVPEEYGGAGEPDYRYRMVVHEEVARVSALSFGLTLILQDDLVLPYLLNRADGDQKKRWLPRMASGESIWAIAMTEPGAGSDLQGIRTTARRDGEDWVVSGQKTFISSGIMADCVIVAVRTDPAAGSRGFSLLVVEDGIPGFSRGRKLDKIGLPGQDTAELFFDDARVPSGNLLAEEGQGLHYLMSHLPRERFTIAASALANSRAVYQLTRAYCLERTAFGQPIADFQNTRFTLAEIETQLDIVEAYLDKSVLALNEGELTPIDAAKGKWFATDLQKNVIDRCLQLYGGYGYMLEYEVARFYLDTRVHPIFGGTNEIMKELIGRDLVRR
jgi:alkylation response protein AidB-like acyl-CoA dehydrogenase